MSYARTYPNRPARAARQPPPPRGDQPAEEDDVNNNPHAPEPRRLEQ